jgi:signal transduction histidine kinase/DNA-binding NarL/FixJ family response regulator
MELESSTSGSLTDSAIVAWSLYGRDIDIDIDIDVDVDSPAGCDGRQCPTTSPAPSPIARILLVGDDAACAALVWTSLKRLRDTYGTSFHWLPHSTESQDLVRNLPMEVILYDLPPEADSFERIDCLQQVCGDAHIVVLTDSESPWLRQHLHQHGVDDYIGRGDIGPTSLRRIIDHAIERRTFKMEIGSSLRRERLRDQILARIAENAPLRDVLGELGQALRRELACNDCGFAIELNDISGDALLWPDDGCSSAQLANSALSYARLHPGSDIPHPDCEACLQSIRSGGRLLGELAMVPGAGAATRETLRTYAVLGADLAALAVDRLQAAESLRQSQEALRQLSAQLLNIQETERQRIAGDLHDVIGQSLSVVKVSIEEAEQQFRNNGSPEVAAILGRLVPWVKTALGEVRRISMDLRPATIDDLGILPTLSWFFREFGASCRNIVVEPRIAIAELDVPEPLKIVIFRILQEAFCNIVKHSQASRVQVVLQRVGASIELAIIDNGVGFDTGKQHRLSECKSGLGLSGMRERARGTNGSYTLESILGVGTSILVSWPLSD